MKGNVVLVKFRLKGFDACASLCTNLSPPLAACVVSKTLELFTDFANRWLPIKVGRLTDGPKEHPNDRQSRLANARLQRWKDGALFFIALALVAVVALLCLFILFSRGYAPETTGGAAVILNSIASGIVGFLGGRQSK